MEIHGISMNFHFGYMMIYGINGYTRCDIWNSTEILTGIDGIDGIACIASELRLEGFVEQYLLRYLGDYIFGVVARPQSVSKALRNTYIEN